MRPDTAISPATIEGRLNAQRRVLAALIAAALAPGAASRDRLRRLVSRDAVAADQSEDPGAVPDPAFALLGAFAEELRLLADEVARIAPSGVSAGVSADGKTAFPGGAHPGSEAASAPAGAVVPASGDALPARGGGPHGG